MTMEGIDKHPSLSQLIWLVRRELEWAHQLDKEHPLRFDVGTVEIETTVEIARSSTGRGGLNLTLFGVGGTAGADRTAGNKSTSIVRVSLAPRSGGGSDGRFDVSAIDLEPPPRLGDVGTGLADDG